MPEKKRQHYVPLFYLRHFSLNSRGKAIGIFNIPSDRFIPSGKLKTQCYKDYFYGQDGKVEKILEIIESHSSAVISDIIGSHTLPAQFSKEHHQLLIFIVFLRDRNVYASEEINEMTDKYIRAVLSKDRRVKDHLNEVRFQITDPTRMALKWATILWPIVLDLEYKLILNQTNKSFLTSDNPVVFYNQFLETRKGFGCNTGLACKGLEIFMPLSPKHYIIFYDRDVYKVGDKTDIFVPVTNPKDIVALNTLQCINARENLYFDHAVSETDVRRLLQAVKSLRRKTRVNVDGYTGPVLPNGLHLLLHNVHREDIKCELALSFASTRRKAKRYTLGTKAVHVRNGEICRLFDEFMELVRNGIYRASEFPKFLRQEGLGGEPER